MGKLKLPAKLLILALVLGGIFAIVKYSGLSIFQRSLKDTVDLQSVALPDAPKDQKGQNVSKVDMPSEEVASVQATAFVQEIMAWNSQMGLIYSNGGSKTAKGSLMEKRGVNLELKRQDDTEQMKADLIKFAKDYKDNPSTASGVNMISIMGDGAPAWLAGVNAELEKLGPEYKAKVFYSPGRSLGEDVFMAPKSVKENPQAAKGLVVACYVRDGDQHIVDLWAASNDIDLNPDGKTYNPDAINFVEASDFVEAGQKYLTGYSEDRPVVRKDPKTGKMTRTGETKHITVNAVASWTPVDVTIAEQKGGIVPIVSTLQYQSQMPNATISISKFLQDNRKLVEQYILAGSEGGDQVKTYPDVLQKAGELSAKVYNEKDGSYWAKYYRGVQQTDATNELVHLGGSRVHNLADNLELYGLGQNKTNVYASIYKTFGDIDTKLYPEYMKSYPSASEAIDLSYVKGAKELSSGTLMAADKITYDSEATDVKVVSKRNWSIEFATGSADLTAAGKATLQQVNSQLTVGSGLRIEVEGFTDNVGNPAFNVDLSQRRAKSVKAYLQADSPELYPNSRFVSVVGKGQDEPIATNTTEAGRAKNRRVSILMVE